MLSDNCSQYKASVFYFKEKAIVNIETKYIDK